MTNCSKVEDYACKSMPELNIFIENLVVFSNNFRNNPAVIVEVET